MGHLRVFLNGLDSARTSRRITRQKAEERIAAAAAEASPRLLNRSAVIEPLETRVLFTNVVANPGFEASGSLSPSWQTQGTAGFGVNAGDGVSHSGSNNGWINTNVGSLNLYLKQTVTVTANTNYSLSAWLQNSGFSTGGVIMAQTTGGTTLASASYGTVANYTQVTTSNFSSGSNTQLVLFFGYTTPAAGGNTWIHVDDVSLSDVATAPSAPTGLTATGGNSQVALSWTAVSGATSYNVYRGTTAGGESATAIATGLTSPSYTDTGLTNGTAYYYKVSAVNSAGESTKSSEASATPALTVPSAPTGLTATGGNAQASLAWTAVSGATSYSVYRGTSAGGESATAIATGLTSPSYTDTGLTNGTTYYYKVSAVNGAGESTKSSEASATANVGVAAQYNFDESSGSTTADASGNGNTGTLVNSPSFVTGHSGNGLSFNGTTQYVSAANSSSLNPTAAITLSAWIKPTDWSGNRRILQKGSTDNQYRLLAESSALKFDLSGVGSITATLPSTGVWHLVTGTYDGTTMKLYVDGTSVASAAHTGAIATTTDPLVIGKKNTGDTTAGNFFYGLMDDVRIYSRALSATEVGALYTSIPSAPTGLTATGGNAQVALSWTAVSGATSYNVYRGTSAGGESATAIATGLTSPSYTDTGLTNGTAYYYKVSAVNSAGESTKSSEASATPALTVPSAPTGLTATGGNAQASLAWTAVSGATSYSVYRGTTAGGESATAIVTGLTSPSYTDTGLTNGTTYYYKVSAVNSAGESTKSSEASATANVGVAVQYNFDESSGSTTADASGNGNTGTLVNSPPFVTGHSGNGLSFNGTTQYVSAANSSSLNPTAAITLSAWIKPTDWSGNRRILQKGSTDNQYRLLAEDSVLKFDLINVGTVSATLPSTGAWHLVTGTYDGTTMKLYVDGTSVASAAHTGAIATTTDPLVIGKKNTGDGTTGNFFYGLMDDVRIYSRALSSTEVSALYSSIPSAPTGLTATGGNAQVALSWTAVSGATSYSVYRGTTAGGESATAIATGLTSPSYTDTGLTNGTAYYYKVSAVNSAGESTKSSEASATPVPAAPSAPTGVTATPGNAQIALAWTAVSGATSYSVYRGTTAGGESATPLATLVSTASYTDSTAANGTTYYYKITAVNAGGESVKSSEVSATPVPAVPSAPTGVTATPGNAQIALAWTAVSGATSYSVYRGTTAGGESATPLATLVGTASYTDSTAANGTTYYYKVTAVNAGGESVKSSEVSATPVPAVPAAPTGVTATPGNNQVALSWTAVSGAATYSVYRGTTAGGESATPLATSIAANSYTDSTAANGTTYYYKITAVNAGGESIKSSEVSATPVPAVPSAPTGVSATPGNAQVALTWTAVSGAASYKVYRGTTAGGESATPLATSVATASYTDSTAANGTTYYYKITAVNAGGESVKSSEVSATPVPAVPAAPTGVSATPGNNQVALTWTAVSGATSYSVYRGTTAGGESATALATLIGTASYTDSTATNGTTYYYKITAVNAGGESVKSSEVSATPVPAVPAAPTGVTATPGNNQVALAWTAVSGATSYSVYRGMTAGGESATPLATLVSTASYTDSTAANGTTYYYKITAVNAGGESVKSSEVSATPVPAVPAAPTGVTATPGNNQVALGWTAVSGATSYSVYRGTTAGGESATALATLIGTASYTDSTAANGTTYYYKITAVNAGGESVKSAEVAAIPGAPVTITVSALNVSTAANELFEGKVATFTDTNPQATGFYVATIHWGDGAITAGSVTATAGGGFAVMGTYTYTEPSAVGGNVLSVTVSSLSSSPSSDAANAFVSTAAGRDATLTAGQVLSDEVATFFDPNPNSNAAGYGASIDWGDGAVSTGTITAEGSGHFKVTGSHEFDTVAEYPVAVLISGVSTGALDAIGSATVAEAPPTVATAASATLSDDGASVGLSVLGAELAGEGDLSYMWSATGGAGVTFNQNGNNDSKNVRAQLSSAGSYTFTVTIKDSAGQSVQNSVNVTVAQIESDMVVTPFDPTISPGQTQQFAAESLDQFGNSMTSQPDFIWSMTTGSGHIDANGLYTAPDIGPASAEFTASADNLSDDGSIEVSDSAPTLTATAVSSTEIDLTYTAPAGHHVELEEQGPDDSNFHTISFPTPNPSTPDVYPLTGLTPGFDYHFKLRSDVNGIATYATAHAATTALPPAAPTYFTASPLSDSKVVLLWEDNASNETGFHLQRKSSGSTTWTTLGDLPTDASSFTDSGLSAAAGYDYRIASFNDTGASAWVAVSVTTADGTALAAPTNVTATATSSTHITVSWSNNSPDATSLVVEADTVSDFGGNVNGSGNPLRLRTWVSSTTVAGTATSADITVPSTFHASGSPAHYVFHVIARNGSSTGPESAPSQPVDTLPDTGGTAPSAPTNLTVTDNPNLAYWPSITFNNSGGISGDEFQVTAVNGLPTDALTAANGLFVQLPNTTYTFKVRTYNAYGYSGWSNTASYTSGTFDVPTDPAATTASNLATYPGGPGALTLTWSGTQSPSAYISTDNGAYWIAADFHVNSDGHGGYIGSLSPNTKYLVRLVTLGQPGLYRMGAPFSGTTAATQPQTVGITAPDPIASKAGDDPGRFIVKRASGSDISVALTVPLTISGTGDDGEDYLLQTGTDSVGDTGGIEIDSLAPSITIPAGSVAAVFSVVPLTTNHVNGDTTVIAAVNASTSGPVPIVVGSPSSAEVDIADPDTSTTSQPAAAPANLSATPYSDDQNAGVRLLWDNTPNNESGFVVQRSTDGGQNWSQIAQVGADVTTYVDNSPPAGVARSYRVGSYAGTDAPAFSNASTDPVPAAPSDLSATHDDEQGTVTLTWTNHATSAEGVEIEWSADNSDFVVIDTVLPTSTSYTDTKPASGSGVNNFYRVVAYRNVQTMQTEVEESNPSNTASGKPVDPPVAVDDDNGGANLDDTVAPYVATRGSTLTVSAGDGVLANDFDPQGLPVTVADHTQPDHGTLTLNSDGSFTYVPTAGFSGDDSFTYSITNGFFSSGEAVVAITVANQPVKAVGDSITLSGNGALSVPAGTLAANDVNPDGSAVTYHLGANGSVRHGALAFNADGSFTYTPDSTFAGVDQFSYYVNDGVHDSNTVPVIIATGGAIPVPPNFSNTAAPDPSTFSNDVSGLWHSYLASSRKLQNVLQAMSDVGAQVQSMAATDSPTDSQLDGAIAGLENVYRKYDDYTVQLAATLHAAANFMRSVRFTTQARADVLNAINTLPATIGGLAANKNELDRFHAAFADYGDGANILAGNANQIVTIAETTHEIAERSIQVIGAVTIVGGLVEAFATKTCTAFAGYVVKQVISTAEATAAGAVAQNAMYWAAKLGGASPDTVRICADSLQLLLLIKAAREQSFAQNSECFVAGTEVLTGPSTGGSSPSPEKPIQDVVVGDEVLSRDQNNPTAPLELRPVTQTFVHTVYDLEDVTVHTSDGGVETIRCTPAHPFYVTGIGWTGASELRPGERLIEPDGGSATVDRLVDEPCPQGILVYNFTVADDHTYFVDQGGAGIWVHNSCYSGQLLPKPGTSDADAIELANHLGGKPSVYFENDPVEREFDVVSDRFIGQAKSDPQSIGKKFRAQATATFEAAAATGRKVFYWFKDTPGPDIIRKLKSYSTRYNVEVEIKIGPL